MTKPSENSTVPLDTFAQYFSGVVTFIYKLRVKSSFSSSIQFSSDCSSDPITDLRISKVFGVFFTVNALSLHYKDQSINSV